MILALVASVALAQVSSVTEVHDFSALVEVPDDAAQEQDPSDDEGLLLSASPPLLPFAGIPELGSAEEELTLERIQVEVAWLLGGPSRARWEGAVLTLTAAEEEQGLMRAYRDALTSAFGGHALLEIVDASSVELPRELPVVLSRAEVEALRPALAGAPFEIARAPHGRTRRLGSRTTEHFVADYEGEVAMWMPAYEPEVTALESGSSLRVRVHRAARPGAQFIEFDHDLRSHVGPVRSVRVPMLGAMELQLPEVRDLGAVGSAEVEIGGAVHLRWSENGRPWTTLVILRGASVPPAAPGYVHLGPAMLPPDVAVRHRRLGFEPWRGMPMDRDDLRPRSGGRLTLEQASPASSTEPAVALGLGGFVDPALPGAATIREEARAVSDAVAGATYGFEVAYQWVSLDDWRAMGGFDFDAEAFSRTARERGAIATISGRVGTLRAGTATFHVRGWWSNVALGTATHAPEVAAAEHGVTFRFEPLTESDGSVLYHGEIQASAQTAPLRTVHVAGFAPDPEQVDPPRTGIYAPFRQVARLPVEVGSSGYAEQDELRRAPLGRWTPLMARARGDGERMFVAAVRVTRHGPAPGGIVEAGEELIVPTRTLHGPGRLGAAAHQPYWSRWEYAWEPDEARRSARVDPALHWLTSVAAGVEVDVVEDDAFCRVRCADADVRRHLRDVIDDYAAIRRRSVRLDVWQVPLEWLDDLPAALEGRRGARAEVVLGTNVTLSRASTFGYVADYSTEPVSAAVPLDAKVQLGPEGLDLCAFVGARSSGAERFVLKAWGSLARQRVTTRRVELPRYDNTPLDLPESERSGIVASLVVRAGELRVLHRAPMQGEALVARITPVRAGPVPPGFVDGGELAAPMQLAYPNWDGQVQPSLGRVEPEAERVMVGDWDRISEDALDPLGALSDFIGSEPLWEEGTWAIADMAEEVEGLAAALDRRAHEVSVAYRRVPAHALDSTLPADGEPTLLLRAIEGDSCGASDVLQRAYLADIDASFSNSGPSPSAPSVYDVMYGTALWYRPIAHANGRVQGLFELTHLAGEEHERTVMVSGMGRVPLALDPSKPGEITLADPPDVPLQVGRSQVVHMEERLDLAPGAWQRVSVSPIPGTDDVLVVFAKAEVSGAE